MLERFKHLPSPAIVIAIGALVLAASGGAFALSKQSDNRKDKKIATKVVKKLAPKLSVKHAKTADSATNATHATNADNATHATNADNATNANSLQGHAASDFLQGSGAEVHNRVVVSANGSQQLLGLGLGHIDGSCSAGGVPTISFTAEVSPINLIESSTTFPNTAAVHTANGLGVGNTFNADPGGPQTVMWQLAENDGAKNHVATAWTTGQDIGGTSCIFTGQGLTTG